MALEGDRDPALLHARGGGPWREVEGVVDVQVVGYRAENIYGAGPARFKMFLIRGYRNF
jgi:hypothetical protein